MEGLFQSSHNPPAVGAFWQVRWKDRQFGSPALTVVPKTNSPELTLSNSIL